MGGFPPGLCDVPGFVGEFAKYCNDTAPRLQPELATVTGLATLATLCSRRVVDPYGNRANVFFVGLAGTSSGKERPRQIAKELLLRCGRSNSLSEAFASHSGLITAVSDSPDHLALIDEFGRYLGAQNSKNAGSHLVLIQTVMMKLFSSSDSVFISDRYADSKHRPTVSIDHPNLNVVGTTVKGNFFGALNSGNVDDGMLNRYLVFEVSVDLPDLRLCNTLPFPQSLVDVADFWVKSGPPSNGGNLSPFVIPQDEDASLILRTFANTCDEIARSGRSQLCRGIWPRTWQKAQKLAMLYACSECHESPKITLTAATWAIAFAAHCTDYVEKATAENVFDNEHQKAAKRVLQMIQEAGTIGIKHSKLYRRVDHVWDARKLRDVIAQLLDSDEISRAIGVTTGRSSFTYFAKA